MRTSSGRGSCLPPWRLPRLAQLRRPGPVDAQRTLLDLYPVVAPCRLPRDIAVEHTLSHQLRVVFKRRIEAPAARQAQDHFVLGGQGVPGLGVGSHAIGEGKVTAASVFAAGEAVGRKLETVVHGRMDDRFARPRLQNHLLLFVGGGPGRGDLAACLWPARCPAVLPGSALLPPGDFAGVGCAGVGERSAGGMGHGTCLARTTRAGRTPRGARPTDLLVVSRLRPAVGARPDSGVSGVGMISGETCQRSRPLPSCQFDI